MRAKGFWACSLIVLLPASAALAQTKVQVRKEVQPAPVGVKVQKVVQPKPVVVQAAGQAQVVIPSRGFGFSYKWSLLQNPAVQEDLKLAPDQKTKLKEVLKDLSAQNTKLFKEPTKNINERNKKIQALYQAAEKAVNSLLNQEQDKRVKQIYLQMQGEAVFNTLELAKALQLTDEQKTLIREIQVDASRASQNMYQGVRFGGDYREIQKMAAQFRRSTIDVIAAVLTPPQQKALKELLGEPFKGDLYPGRGGFFGGAGGAVFIPSNIRLVPQVVPPKRKP